LQDHPYPAGNKYNSAQKQEDDFHTIVLSACVTIKTKGNFGKKNLKPLRKLNPLLWKYRRRLFAGIIFVALSNAFAIIPAKYTRETINLLQHSIPALNEPGNGHSPLTEAGDFSSQLFLFLFFIIGSTLLRGVFMFFMRQGIIVVSRQIEYDLKNQVFKHYLIQDISFFKTNQTGDLMARISEDISQVRMYIGPAIMYTVNLIVLFIITISVMCSIHVPLTLIILIPLPFLAFSIYRVSQNIHRKSLYAQKIISDISSTSQSVFSGIRIVKSFRSESLFSKLMQNQSEMSKEAQAAIFKTESLFSPLVGFLIGLSNLLVVFAGSYFHLRGEISLGSIAEFVIYVNMLTWPVTSIGWVSSLIQKASASQARINAFWESKPKIIPGTSGIPQGGDIIFENVSFSYPETGIRVLEHFNLTLKPGKKYGITGRTGSGKSTIIALLLRQYDPDEGRILYGGQEIKTFHTEAWRSRLSVVFQDVFLFSDTIARNITREELKESDWGEIFQKSGLSSTIQEMKTGRDTTIGERGVMLSGGQKQRVSIARAMVKKSDIFILDDCFSAIDPVTEAYISSEVERLNHPISIIISHRPASLMYCDQVLLLEGGKITGAGSHQELLLTSESYALICRSEENAS
jgi:ATP-binding cassette subfamily B multidrug efflux pump